MATITRSLSTKTDGNDRVEFMLRINSNRTTRVRVRSGIFVPKEFAGVKGYNRIEVSIKNISGLSV